jgi:hypothetical protein
MQLHDLMLMQHLININATYLRLLISFKDATALISFTDATARPHAYAAPYKYKCNLFATLHHAYAADLF